MTKVKKIDSYDFGGISSQTYKKKCPKCKTKEIIISTQKDNYPEYHTDVYVQCMYCGCSVKFVLPVN